MDASISYMGEKPSAFQLACWNLLLSAMMIVMACSIAAVFVYLGEPLIYSYHTDVQNNDSIRNGATFFAVMLGIVAAQCCFWIGFFRGHPVHLPSPVGRARFGLLPVIACLLVAGLLLWLNVSPEKTSEVSSHGWPAAFYEVGTGSPQIGYSILYNSRILVADIVFCAVLLMWVLVIVEWLLRSRQNTD